MPRESHQENPAPGERYGAPAAAGEGEKVENIKTKLILLEVVERVFFVYFFVRICLFGALDLVRLAFDCSSGKCFLDWEQRMRQTPDRP